jgi:hypothetical protein
VCALAVGSLSGCVTLGNADSPALFPPGLQGRWVSGDGASITFKTTGTFTATRVDFGKALPRSCGVVSGAGTWQLGSGAQANIVTLYFTRMPTSPDCTGAEFLTMTSWDTGSARGLCVQLDPDTPCNEYIFTER